LADTGLCLLVLELLNICVLSAAAAILQYDGYLRHSEFLAVMFDDVLRPSSTPCFKSTEQLGVSISYAERAETTKTRQQNYTVNCYLGPSFWVNRIVEIVFHRSKPGELLCVSLSLAQCEDRFRPASLKLELPATITPHDLRHSRPSCNVLGETVTV
jgi:hypothetical protein